MLVDVGDTIVEVHGYAKQGASFGYTRVRGLNTLLATAGTAESAPVVVAQRLRRGSCGSPRGAKRLVADAVKTVTRLTPGRPMLLRADSAFYGRDTIAAAIRAGAEVSVTVKQTAPVKAGIAAINADAWIPIAYRKAVFDEATGRWISRAEVAEISFTAFASGPKTKQVPGRLVVRRIPELNPTGQAGLFAVWRYHAFFTTSRSDSLDTVAADKIHRGHAVIEQVHADLKNSALAHLPSGRFTAKAAWLVLAVIAFNLTRAAATLTGPQLAKATTGTIRRTLIAVPARIATSARRLMLHLPINWPWQQAWTAWFNRVCGPPVASSTYHPARRRDQDPVEQTDSEVRNHPCLYRRNITGSAIKINPQANRWIEASVASGCTSGCSSADRPRSPESSRRTTSAALERSSSDVGWPT